MGLPSDSSTKIEASTPPMIVISPKTLQFSSLEILEGKHLSSVGSVLASIGKLGEKNNSILIQLVDKDYNWLTVREVLFCLKSSFGWFEASRECRVETLRGRDRNGCPTEYKTKVWRIIIEKEGPLRK